jgi:hypothetical protein
MLICDQATNFAYIIYNIENQKHFEVEVKLKSDDNLRKSCYLPNFGHGATAKKTQKFPKKGKISKFIVPNPYGTQNRTFWK